MISIGLATAKRISCLFCHWAHKTNMLKFSMHILLNSNNVFQFHKEDMAQSQVPQGRVIKRSRILFW